MKTLFDDLEGFLENPTPTLELKISAKVKAKLSKEQLFFNRLIDRIQKLESSLDSEKDKAEFLFSYFEKEVKPQLIKLAEKQIESVFKLSELSNKFQLSKSTLSDIGDIIIYTCDKTFGFLTVTPELENLYDEWSGIPYQNEVENQKEEAKSGLEDYIREMFGESIDMEDVDMDDPESMLRFQAKMKELFEGKEKEESEKSAKKKSLKQQAKEDLEKAAELIKNKSLRSIYISLSKILHPDTETVEELKNQKLELMKSVTAAYDQKDLKTLLRLEMEWVYKTSEHLEQLADEKLKVYTSVLKERVSELEREKFMIHRNPKFFNVYRFLDFTQQKAMIFIKEERDQKLDSIKYFESEIKSIEKLRDKKTIKEYVKKTHRMLMNDYDDFDDFF